MNFRDVDYPDHIGIEVVVEPDGAVRFTLVDCELIYAAFQLTRHGWSELSQLRDTTDFHGRAVEVTVGVVTGRVDITLVGELAELDSGGISLHPDDWAALVDYVSERQAHR